MAVLLLRSRRHATTLPRCHAPCCRWQAPNQTCAARSTHSRAETRARTNVLQLHRSTAWQAARRSPGPMGHRFYVWSAACRPRTTNVALCVWLTTAPPRPAGNLRPHSHFRTETGIFWHTLDLCQFCRAGCCLPGSQFPRCWLQPIQFKALKHWPFNLVAPSLRASFPQSMSPREHVDCGMRDVSEASCSCDACSSAGATWHWNAADTMTS